MAVIPIFFKKSSLIEFFGSPFQENALILNKAGREGSSGWAHGRGCMAASSSPHHR